MDILENNISQIEDFLTYQEEIKKGQKLKFIFVISKKSIFKIINEWIPYDYKFKVKEKKKHFMKLEITRELKRILRRKIQGIFFLYRIKPTNLYVFFTFENTPTLFLSYTAYEIANCGKARRQLVPLPFHK